MARPTPAHIKRGAGKKAASGVNKAKGKLSKKAASPVTKTKTSKAKAPKSITKKMKPLKGILKNTNRGRPRRSELEIFLEDGVLLTTILSQPKVQQAVDWNRVGIEMPNDNELKSTALAFARRRFSKWAERKGLAVIPLKKGKKTEKSRK